MAEWKNNGKIKLLIIVGTRPEIIRLAITIKRCKEYFDCIVGCRLSNLRMNLKDMMKIAVIILC